MSTDVHGWRRPTPGREVTSKGWVLLLAIDYSQKWCLTNVENIAPPYPSAPAPPKDVLKDDTPYFVYVKEKDKI